MAGDFGRGIGGPVRQLRLRLVRGQAARRTPKSDLHRTVRLATAWTGGVLAVTILAVSGYGWAVTDAVDAATVRADIFSALGGRPADSPATDILIVGSDSRIGMSQDALDRLHAGSEAAADGARSDTMILAQLAADQKSLTLLSIPRDSYVDIPAWKGHPEHHDKINSALNLGGPALTVATVERAIGVRVDHYVQVDFSAFAQIVDAVGGVDVCLPKATDDPLSGLTLPAGVSHAGGVEALAYVRARYTLTGGSDLGRIHRQQEFLGSLAARAASSDVVTDPSRLAGLVRSVAAAVQTDSGLDTETMLNLALAMKAVPRDRIRFVSMPLADVDHQAPGGIGSTVLWDPTVSARLFQALREDKPVDQVAAEASADPTTTASPSAEPAAPTEATPTASKRRARAKVQAPQPSAMSVHTADQSICH